MSRLEEILMIAGKRDEVLKMSMNCATQNTASKNDLRPLDRTGPSRTDCCLSEEFMMRSGRVMKGWIGYRPGYIAERAPPPAFE